MEYFNADTRITKSIKQLCDELDVLHADDPKFIPTVEAIAKLRSSMNVPIIQHKD